MFQKKNIRKSPFTEVFSFSGFIAMLYGYSVLTKTVGHDIILITKITFTKKARKE